MKVMDVDTSKKALREDGKWGEEEVKRRRSAGERGEGRSQRQKMESEKQESMQVDVKRMEGRDVGRRSDVQGMRVEGDMREPRK